MPWSKVSSKSMLDGGRQPDKAMVNIAEAGRQCYQNGQDIEKFHGIQLLIIMGYRAYRL
jgi:hypothetical protein